VSATSKTKECQNILLCSGDETGSNISAAVSYGGRLGL